MKFYVVQADISQEKEVAALFAGIKGIGPVDVLVANAGYLSTPTPVAASDTQDWWTSFEINVKGTYLLAKYFINQEAKPEKDPVFISMNSGVAHIGTAFGPNSAYAASKLGAASMIGDVERLVQ
jgi:NAD(P)-dependent dehydrogenase (short-subunit alcohol dehydrogenase family)